MKRRRSRHNFANPTPDQIQSPRRLGPAQRWRQFFGTLLFKKAGVIFWLVYLCVPVFTGWLDYQSLPDEIYDPTRHELLKSHIRDAWPEGLGTYRVPDSWRNEATGTIYTAGSFSEHRQSEAARLGINYFAYGLIGCAFFAYSRGRKEQSAFFGAFRNSLIFNAAVAVFVFLMT